MRRVLDFYGFLIDANNKPEEKAGIYCIKHLPSGKCYIGASKNLAKRIRSHASAQSSTPFHDFIRNQEAFSFKASPLYYSEDLTSFPEIEESLCAAYDSHQNGFNERTLYSRNMHTSSAHERRMTAMARTMATDAFKAKRSAASKKFHARPDVKEKHRASVIAANANPITKEKIAASKRGRFWVTNGQNCRHLKAGTPIPKGWRPGKK